MTILHDRADISDLLATYALSADAQDYPTLVDCFTDDAVLEMAHGTLEGIDAIRASMDGEALAQARQKNSGLQFDRSTHLTGNILIRIDGDTGTAESSAVVYLVGPGSAGDLMAIRGVTYSDVVRRTPSGWKLAKRVHRLLWQRGPEPM